jgi:hypothetical protein
VSGEPAAEAGGPAAVLTLHQYPEQLVVAGLAPGTEVPSWAESSSLFAVVATALETTIVCAGRYVPKKVRKQGPFTGFAVSGHVDPALTGVLAGLLDPLAEEGISVLTLSTYSTDWILVPRDRADDAGAAWRRRGHDVVPAPVITSGKS